MSTKVMVVVTAVMCLAAVIAFMDSGILGADAQERPPATRPADDADQAAADEAGEAAEEADDHSEAAADDGREPGHRPEAAADDGAEGDDTGSIADAVGEAAEDIALPAIPIPPMMDAEYQEAHQAFYQCLDAVYNELRPNDKESSHEADDIIFENCVPLLPEEEVAAITAMRPYEVCARDIYGAAFADEGPMSEEEYMAVEQMVFDECFELLPAEQQAEMLAWRAYRECIDTALGDGPSSQLDYLLASQSCLDELPPELAEMEAASINFQVCLAENGAFDNEPQFTSNGIVVPVLVPSGVIQVDFGTGPSSVTLSSDGETITATSDGVAVIYEMNFEEHFPVKDAAYETCAELDPYAQDGISIVGPIPVPFPIVAVAGDAVEEPATMESPVIGLARMAQRVSR